MNASDMISIAKRNHNIKRQYLLVNKIQGKHIPVDPNVCLGMLTEFGQKLKAHYPNVRLVIGFAETATAVGAAIAAEYDNAFYITTTREPIETNNVISFKEEHSHAVDHMLVKYGLAEIIQNTDTILLIDDELSTGKTIRNIVNALREQIPEICSKQIVAASIVNRMSEDDLALFAEANIECDWYAKMPNEDYSKLIKSFTDATDPDELDKDIDACPVLYTLVDYRSIIPDIRYGYNAREYREKIAVLSTVAAGYMKNIHGNVLVLGTEECMYPAIQVGSVISKILKVDSVKTHSTTRSPICVLNAYDYPIKNGYKIRSFYGDRETYVYNTRNDYDTIVIVTDAKGNIDKAVRDTIFAFHCQNVYVLRY